MRYGYGFAVSRQIQKHVLVTKTLTILVLDKGVAICVQLHFAGQDKVHVVGVITAPIKNVSLGKLDVFQALHELPHEFVIVHRLKEIDSVNELSVVAEEDLISQTRRKSLDQLVVFILRDLRHRIRLNILFNQF